MCCLWANGWRGHFAQVRWGGRIPPTTFNQQTNIRQTEGGSVVATCHTRRVPRGKLNTPRPLTCKPMYRWHDSDVSADWMLPPQRWLGVRMYRLPRVAQWLVHTMLTWVPHGRSYLVLLLSVQYGMLTSASVQSTSKVNWKLWLLITLAYDVGFRWNELRWKACD